MAYGDTEAPDDGSNDGSSGGDPIGSQGADAPSVGPGTGQNPDNPAKGVNVGGLLGGTTGSSATDSALAGLLGMLGFNPSAPAVGVNVETEQEPQGHPDWGLGGTPMDSDFSGYASTDPGYEKAVYGSGKALSYNKARQINLYERFEPVVNSLEQQINALRQKKNKTQDDYKELTKLSKQYQNLIESDQYQKLQAHRNPALGMIPKALAGALGLGAIGFAPAIENALIERGHIDTTSPQDVMDADPADDAPEGPDQINNTEDQNPATFWSLMNTVRNNKSIFQNVSSEKMKELLSNPEKFWKFYENATEENNQNQSEKYGPVLWKPVSEKDKNLVILTPANLGKLKVYLADGSGKIIEMARSMGRTNGRRHTYRFSRPGSMYGSNTTLVIGGVHYPVSNPSVRSMLSTG